MLQYYCYIMAIFILGGCSCNLYCRRIAESYGYKVIPTFCGHGIGSYFHGPPDIIHVGLYASRFLGLLSLLNQISHK